MSFAQIIGGEPVECVNPIAVEGGNVSPESVALWSDEQREEAGIYTIVEPTADPDFPPTAFELQIVGEEVRRVITETRRREIPKSTVQARVDALGAGKFDAVYAVISSAPIYFARWFAPDWKNVFFDDEGMLIMLAAAGLSPEEIATVTA